MLIQRDEVIAGRPAVEVRELMRTMRRTAHSVVGLAGELDIGLPEAAQSAADLRAGGLVEITEDYSGPYVVGLGEDLPSGGPPRLLITTITGNALAKARIGKPMSRTKAQGLCDGVIAEPRKSTPATTGSTGS